MKLIIIIPAYNEAKTIARVIRGIPSAIPGVAEKEVVVINDGSFDDTVKVSREAGAQVVSHSKNLGLGVVFSTGIKEALSRKGDLMVTIDADGQFDHSDISKLIQPIVNSEADVVLGSRFMTSSPRLKMPAIKLIGNQLMSKFISMVCGQKFFDVSCGFRAYSKEALLNLNIFGKFTYTQEVILNLSFKNLTIKEVPISAEYFPERVSYITGNLKKYVFNSLKIIFRTVLDYLPLRFFGLLGLVFFLAGLVLDIIMISIFWKTGQFSPYKSVGVFGLVLNAFGLILFVVGLVADMLGRIRHNQERIIYFQKKELYKK